MTALAIGYAVALFVVLLCADVGVLAPLAQHVNAYPVLDNVVHFFMYGGLALVVNAALARARRGTLTRAIVTGSIVVLMVARSTDSNLLVPQPRLGRERSDRQLIRHRVSGHSARGLLSRAISIAEPAACSDRDVERGRRMTRFGNMLHGTCCDYSTARC